MRWTKETVTAEALKYKNRTEFKKQGKGCSTAAVRLGIYDEVTAHMPYKNNLQKRCVYLITNEKVAYVGLTWNFETRVHADPAKAALRAAGEYIRLTDYVEVSEAQRLERYWIEFYKDQGYKMLNKARGGSLGACRAAKHLFKGEMLSVREIAARIGVSYETLRRRLHKGETFDMVDRPVYAPQELTYRGETMTLKKWGAILDIAVSTIRYRLARGMSTEKILLQ